MNATYQNLASRFVDSDVFLKGNYLVYVVCLPLTNHMTYNVYHVLPLPIKIKNADSKLMFTLLECEYLLMDIAKQYHDRLRIGKTKM
jgi:hypothetical protein